MWQGGVRFASGFIGLSKTKLSLLSWCLVLFQICKAMHLKRHPEAEERGFYALSLMGVRP
jgi:hypothetical protein